MKLRIRAFALTTGTVLGLAIFMVTLLYIMFYDSSETLVKLHKVFFGYEISFLGSFIGLFWGLVYGIIGGSIFALLYNKFISIFPERNDK